MVMVSFLIDVKTPETCGLQKLRQYTERVKKDMKKQNPLTLMNFSYRKWYYLTHPWKWMNHLYWNIRNFWHRGKYGYAYTDAWSFCTWYPQVAAEALRYLALHNNAYPDKNWNSMREWRDYLNYLANRLERCARSQNIDFGAERNEYYNLVTTEPTQANLDNCNRFMEREEEIHKADYEYNLETFRWLAEDLSDLWD